MKILLAHNHYGNKVIGGEMMVFKTEKDLLEANGFEVLTYEKSNNEVLKDSLFKKISRLKNIHWSESTIVDAGRVMDQFRPKVLHVHNYKYVITPSIFKAAKQRNIKTVLTVHNYRLVVPCGNFMSKNGKVCEECLDNRYSRILVRRCVQDSFIKSFTQYQLFMKTKNELNQLNDLVDVFLVLTKFTKENLINAGVDSSKIVIKPNFVNNYNFDDVLQKKNRALFVGRLSNEKGIIELINNWKNIKYPLYIIGSGPLENKVKNLIKSNMNIIFLGSMNNENVIRFMKESSFLILPSNLYEGMPLTILEAFSMGLPVLASNLGPRKDIIQDNYNGLLYVQETFHQQLTKLLDNKELLVRLGRNAKYSFEQKYSSRHSLKILKQVYCE